MGMGMDRGREGRVGVRGGTGYGTMGGEGDLEKGGGGRRRRWWRMWESWQGWVGGLYNLGSDVLGDIYHIDSIIENIWEVVIF